MRMGDGILMGGQKRLFERVEFEQRIDGCPFSFSTCVHADSWDKFSP